MRISQLPWRLLASLRDVRRLGLFQAVKLWICSGRDREFSISAKGFDCPFRLRGKTSDSWVFRSLIVSDEYALIPESLSPRTILDAGANAGFGIRWLKQRWLAGVSLIQGALWAEDGRASFVCAGDVKYALRVKMDEAGPIQCLSVGGIMRQMGWDRIDLLKMDIEGAEREVFGPGAKEWINRIGVLVVELHEGVSPGCTVKLFEALHGTNFTLRWRGENLVVLFHSEPRNS